MVLLSVILYGIAAIFAFFVIVTLYYSINWSKNHYWKDKNVPCQEPPTFMKLMRGLFFDKKMYWVTDQEWCKANGKTFGCYQLMKPTLYTTDPEVIRKVLVKDFHMLPDRRVFDFLDPIVNSFPASLSGDDWKRVRSIITPAFSTGKLKKMIGLMRDIANTTVENLTKRAEEGGVIDCKNVFNGFTLDVIANTAFGTQLNTSQDPDNVFVQHAKAFFNINFPWRAILVITLPRVARLFGISLFRREDMDFFIDLTNDVMKRRKQTKENRGDFLQNLLEAQMRGAKEGEQIWEEYQPTEDQDALSEESLSFLSQYSKNKTLSTEEFVAACVQFFLAGFDTTATTIAMTAYFLALNPECQQRVVEEVDEISSKHPDLDYETLSKLKYLDGAISETLRLVPPATRLERKAVCDYYIEEADVTVPKDMIVGVPIYAMHMDPDNFPNPDKYDPERFLPENKESVKPYTYLPFGSGPRNCLGMRFALMEIKLCLFHVFKEVTFEPCAETKIPPELYRGSGLYQPKDVNLRVVRRSRSS